MPIILNENIQSNSPKSLDNKYMIDGVTPYADVAEANSIIPLTYRSIGLTVNIANVEYWYKDGVADINLVIKGGAGGGLISVTYAELTTLIGANGLIQGQGYLLTDFRTSAKIPNVFPFEFLLGSIEPLILEAIDVNKISDFAISTIYPQDTIQYEVVDTTLQGGDMGRIYYRKDNLKNITTYYDWRNVKFRRWESAPSSNIFNQLNDNGNAFNDYFTFVSLSVVSNVSTSLAFGGGGAVLNNNVFFVDTDSSYFNGRCVDNTILSYCQNNIVDGNFTNNIFNEFQNNTISGNCSRNTVGLVFTYNVIQGQFGQNQIGGDFSQNVINTARFTNNTIGNNFTANTISGVSFISNSIGSFFASNNILGGTFNDNTISSNFTYNKISYDFIMNVISNAFSYNNIGYGFQSNIISDGFFDNNIEGNFSSNTIGIGMEKNNFSNEATGNVIGDYYSRNVSKFIFNGNSIGNNCKSNEFGNRFGGNIILDNFSFNKFDDEFRNNDFSASTYVYLAYTKRINQRDDGTFILSFLDNTNTVNYVSPIA